jgi:glycosyltransferase involved in cell wall biosynthesis
MIKRPLFSIVTVCLNAGDNLLKTANSIKSQDFDDFEYIIKDGGSKNETLKIAESIGPDRLIVKSDDGIFDAMNQALELCSGRYVNFLNAGDVFCDSHVLSHVANSIAKKQGVDFIYGDVISPQHPRKYVIYPDRLSRYFLYASTICHQAWFVSRSIYTDLGEFNASYPIGSDYLFLLKAFLVKKVIALHVKYFVVEYQGGGLSDDPFLKKQSQQWRQAARKQLYHPLEYILYLMTLKLRNTIKPILYDTFLFKIHRFYGRYLYTRRNRQKYYK